MSTRVDDEQLKDARGAALAGVIGESVSYLSAKRVSRDDSVRDEIARRQVMAAKETRTETGQFLPDLNSPQLSAARSTILEYQERLGTMWPCDELQANAEEDRLLLACQTLAEAQRIRSIYDQKTSSLGVPQLESQLKFTYINEIGFYGGAAVAIVGTGIAAGAFATAVGRKIGPKISGWLNKYSPITFLS